MKELIYILKRNGSIIYDFISNNITGDIVQRTREYYKKLVSYETKYIEMLKKFLQAFFFGGLLCLIGQLFLEALYNFFNEADANLYLLIIMVTIAGVLSAIGVYDDIGQVAKCGIAIPITGFSNACVSSAMEYKKEGLVLGIGSNLLKLAGSVIVLGTASAIVVNIIRYIFWVIGWDLKLIMPI